MKSKVQPDVKTVLFFIIIIFLSFPKNVIGHMTWYLVGGQQISYTFPESLTFRM